jgi:acetyl-CoA acetyltransferase
VNAYVRGVAVTPFGRLPGRDSLDLQVAAAEEAVDDAGVDASDIDAVVVGYSTVLNHLMPADLFAERFGLRPAIAAGLSSGGATGVAMLAHAVRLVENGRARAVLVVAGENRATGASRADSTRTLAQVGHPAYEVPLGATIPAYYGLLASRYLWSFGLPDDALAPLPVQMRAHAAATEGAQFRDPITVEDVLASRTVASPLHLLECCPMSDGGAAFVVSAVPDARSIEVVGVGEAHRHQHLSLLDMTNTGARAAAERAFAGTGLSPADVDVFGIYDSFSVTVAMIVEEIGMVPAGKAGAYARAGAFAVDGRYPMNTHGGLLSYGHCGVGGGMAHVAEVVTQLRGERGASGVSGASLGYVHADGGVLSAHAAAVLRRPA